MLKIDELLVSISDRLVSTGRQLAVSESITAGGLSYYLTQVPGASAWFLGGVVTYTDKIKMDLLGVDAKIIETHGVVSEQTAVAMAERTVALTGAHYGLGITGFAGPSGGTSNAPVGCVHMAFTKGGDSQDNTAIHQVHQFVGGREQIRFYAIEQAITLIHDNL